MDVLSSCVLQSCVKKHREAVKLTKLAERLGGVVSKIDSNSKMAVRHQNLSSLVVLISRSRQYHSHGCLLALSTCVLSL